MTKINRHLLTFAIFVVLTPYLTGEPAAAKNRRATNFFTTPDTRAGDAPSFVGRQQVAPTPPMGVSGEMPRQDMIKAIPSLTDAQRKQIDELFNQSRKELQPINAQLSSLQKTLAERAANAKTSEPDIVPAQAFARPNPSKSEPAQDSVRRERW